MAGQAVLALVNPESNGLAADAVILVYHAGEKRVYSINAEGTAPRLATIDWYNKNNGGKIPNSDGLLSLRRCPALSMRGMYCSIAGAP